VRWWRREEHQRAPAARPRRCGRCGPKSGEVQRNAGLLRAVEGPRSPRGCVWGAGCDGDNRRGRCSGGDGNGAAGSGEMAVMARLEEKCGGLL
jgi:hypothetical protein